MEDNHRRLQGRLKKLLASGEPPAGLHIALDWPHLDEGGVEVLDDWLGEHPDARLLIVDTLARFKPSASGRRSSYGEDRAAVDSLAPIAAEHNVAILLVHHLREMESDDPLDMITGSVGLPGGVDGALVFKRQRGECRRIIARRWQGHRELDRTCPQFRPERRDMGIVGDAEEYRMSEGRRAILRILENADEPLGPKEIAAILAESKHRTGYETGYGAVREMLSQMVKDGQAKNLGRGRYVHPGGR